MSLRLGFSKSKDEKMNLEENGWLKKVFLTEIE